MLTRTSIFALAAIATIATAALAPTSASAFGDGSIRFSHHGRGGWFSVVTRIDPYKNFKFRLGGR